MAIIKKILIEKKKLFESYFLQSIKHLKSINYVNVKKLQQTLQTKTFYNKTTYI